jgi:hypothetical protein
MQRKTDSRLSDFFSRQTKFALGTSLYASSADDSFNWHLNG